MDLLKIDCSGHVEKKNGLSYLSWAWAWTEALKADPAANFIVSTWTKDDGTTQCWMDVNGTAMVWVTVTMKGQARTCMLPVMDHRNKPIPEPDAFQINTAIMRCLTKALALHGLGLHIYAGEDLPESVEEKPATKVEKKSEPKPEEPKTETKPPAKSEGKEGPWQIVVRTKPDATKTDYVNIVSEATVILLDVAKTQADLMEMFKVNRVIFDKVKEYDGEVYKDLMDAFKAKKESLK